MTSQTVLSALFWLAAVVYAIAFGLFAVALVFRKPGTLGHAITVAWAGFFAHSVVMVARWVQTGHPAFVSYFESMSASAWFGMLAFLALQQWKPFLRPAGAGLMPLIVLLMGWAGTRPFGGQSLPVSLQSFWLFVHAGFATAAAGCFLLAAGVAGMRLYQQRRNAPSDPAYHIAPGDRYDEFNFRLILLGFLFWGIMTVSGAIWADGAWGRYWAWDPVEVWSLISWLVYAVYLHIYTVWRRLRGVFLAWYAIIGALFVAMSLWGIGFLYRTLHTYGGN
ncbi:MAG TPA: cytochrome c biogenesis protein CcsA [Burkholderiales bacterium]|nr:cytochrome c biogenesis protein CcsA [Burkholderiales bacterium]